MGWISTYSLGLSGIVLAETLIRKTDFFSPVRLYLFFHSLTLGIAFLSLHKAMTPFHPFTWLVYLGSGFSYVCGAWIVGLIGSTYYSTQNNQVPTIPISSYNWRFHFLFAFLLAAVFSLGMAVASFGIGSVPLFAKDKGVAIRDFFTVNWFASVALSYGGVVMALFFMAIFRSGARRKLGDLAFWMTSIVLIIYSLALSRSGLIFFAFFALIYFHQAVKRISILRLVLLFSIFLSLFAVSAYVKLSNYQKHSEFGSSGAKTLGLAMKFPYIYVANNFWNLDFALNPENFQERHPTTYGFSTISGVLDMMLLPGGGIGPGIRQVGGYDDQFHSQSIKVKGLNTMGYQWGLYKDFGVLGAFAAPFVFGIFFGTLYFRMKKRKSILSFATYSYLSYFVGFSWFLAFWESMIYVYGFFYVVFCCWLAQRLSAFQHTMLGSPQQQISRNAAPRFQ